MKAAVDNTKENGHGCGPIKSLLQKHSASQIWSTVDQLLI
jgi:hypothetical protein